ncbi:MAG: glycosyltransferase family 4 protein [Phycisphaerae bacterium]|nr:glycosyltransferase family 4 protein [Phycisphaerae bacterium]
MRQERHEAVKIAQLTPGSGDNFYCENCLRDLGFIKAAGTLGHDVLMVPMYLPVSVGGEQADTASPVFFGGINVYLQQKLDFFQRTPRWVDRLFDSPKLLSWVGRKASMTDARTLGEMTVSMLRGENGRQAKEMERLAAWLGEAANRPDIVVLSNALLAGAAGVLKERVGAKVVCLLQDEDGFLDGLGEPYASQAWQLVRQRVGDIDGFVAASGYYADVMRRRLSIDAGKMHVAHAGISLEGCDALRLEPEAPTIGYLSRMCAARGLDTLVEAFVLLKQDPALSQAKLKIAGGQMPGDAAFVRGVQKRLAACGLTADVEFAPDYERSARFAFLRGLSVLSVPEKQPVACGLYVAEALAVGVPAVQPTGGVFDELSTLTDGGCVTYEPNDAAILAKRLAALLKNRERLRELGQAGKEAVFEKFDIRRTAERVMGIYREICNSSAV